MRRVRRRRASMIASLLISRAYDTEKYFGSMAYV